MRQRRGKTKPVGEVTDWGALGFIMAILLGCMVSGAFAALFKSFNTAVLQVQSEADGHMNLRPWIYDLLKKAQEYNDETKEFERKIAETTRDAPHDANKLHSLESQLKTNTLATQGVMDKFFRNAGSERQTTMGGDQMENEKAVRRHYKKFGFAGFVKGGFSLFGLHGKVNLTPLAGFTGLLVVGLWFLMLAFQGEGLELDFQRRRHPMWEWLMSHPVNPGAVFMGEMISPLAVNPYFVGAPIFWIGIHWIVYDQLPLAIITGIVTGLPVAVAACCISKALEIATMLRLSPRTRGAVLGIMSWLGYSLFFVALGALSAHGLIVKATAFLAPVGQWFSWPMLGWLVGFGMGTPSVWKGVLVCWALSAVLIYVAVSFSAWATNKGLAGGFGSVVNAPGALSANSSKQWLRDPLYRKELLWFWRDRGALVQVFLIPMTLAAQQVFNLRNLADLASRSWHTLAGAAVIFGTYFLFILGPRSLISEGSALWIPLTWPRGMEGLLKAKARLWWCISCFIVFLGLAVDAFMFPGDVWRVALIAVGWFLFSGSLAEKSVTLVTVPSSSGEPEPVPRGRRWAASLGTFTFAVGVITQRWSLAFVGIVYSWLTSAAMWQNFRARLPYLFDPWSEKLPEPPTLMHAMISISTMTEGLAVIFGIMLAFLGKEQATAAQSVAYCIAGLLAWFFVHSWMTGRGVQTADIWQWPGASGFLAHMPMILKGLLGTAIGTGLGFCGVGYDWIIHHIPWLHDLLITHESTPLNSRESKFWLFISAVAVAPLAEEYLFRGLLFRALDREWGGWRALVASSLFFAIYHPPMSWIPVAVVGMVNAWMFRRSGHLLLSVLVHMAYNATVVWWS